MSKFTPGPWEIDIAEGYDTRSEEIKSESGKFICSISSHPFDKETQANARLIAAAPEMYEAMAIFCDRVERGEVRSKRTYVSFKEILRKVEDDAN